MNERKKESQRLRAYRAVLKGTTNGQFVYDRTMKLGCTYRTRISELRLEMQDKFGAHPEGDWIPRVQLEPKEDNIFRWKLLVPPGCRNPRDPLLLLDLPAEKKVIDREPEKESNQTRMSFETGGDHGQDGNEGDEEACHEGTGQGASAA